MCPHKILIVKSEFKLNVLDDKDKVVRTYPIAIGARADGKARIYEEDFRTPEGSFNVTCTLNRSDLSYLNNIYYPFYLAHHSTGKFSDFGKGAYGHGLISLNYPRPEDIALYNKLREENKIKEDWTQFMEEKWREIFEYVAKRDGKPFDEVVLDSDKHLNKCFLEGKTFETLYNLIPPQPELPMGIHGTPDDGCIGKKISGGCVRMHNDDVTQLVRSYVRNGMIVEIVN